MKWQHKVKGQHHSAASQATMVNLNLKSLLHSCFEMHFSLIIAHDPFISYYAAVLLLDFTVQLRMCRHFSTAVTSADHYVSALEQSMNDALCYTGREPLTMTEVEDL